MMNAADHIDDMRSLVASCDDLLIQEGLGFVELIQFSSRTLPRLIRAHAALSSEPQLIGVQALDRAIEAFERVAEMTKERVTAAKGQAKKTVQSILRQYKDGGPVRR